MPVSAHMLMAGLVRKVPVAIQSAAYCIGSISSELRRRAETINWGAAVNDGTDETSIFRMRKEFEDIKCSKAFCFCSFHVNISKSDE